MKNPEMKKVRFATIETIIEAPIQTQTHFGQTVSYTLPVSGDFTECFNCHKTHRAFVRPENYYKDYVCTCNGCCPVIEINLPPIQK